MDIQEIHEQVRKQREQGFISSAQFSLGDLISEIEKIGVSKEDGSPKEVSFDFGSAIPTSLDSWRGSYDELALGYSLTGYDNSDNSVEECNAEQFLEHLKSAIGQVYEGWKGGDYRMTEKTPIWVDNPGNVGNTGVVGVLDDRWRIVLLTAYCEY